MLSEIERLVCYVFLRKLTIKSSSRAGVYLNKNIDYKSELYLRYTKVF